MHPVGAGQEFFCITQQGIRRQIAGRHQNIFPERIGNFCDTFGNRLAKTGRVSAEYSVYNIHIPGGHQPIAEELVSFAYGHPGINRYAIGSGFGIKSQLGADIPALMQKAADMEIPRPFKKLFFAWDHYCGRRKKRTDSGGTESAVDGTSLKFVG